MSTASEQTMQQRVDSECQRLYEVRSIVELVNRALRAFSGDEDSLDITTDLSTHSYALDGAHKLMGDILERMELIAHDAGTEAKSD
jgi:hypothetical protein